MTFEEIYQRNFAKAVRYTRRHYRLNEDDANKIVTDAFLKLLRVLQAGKEVKHSNAWLRRVIRNRLVDHIRHKNRIKRGRGWRRIYSPLPVEHKDFAVIDNMDAIEVLLSQLTPAMRELANLVLVEDLSYVEAAKRLNISIRTAKRHMIHVRNKLHTLIS
jgi:RNA polymerase sigma-70 factor (ECF subfamily)